MEIALVKVTNDLLVAANAGLLIPILLDFSAAFNTILHTILLKHLALLDITDIPLSWFTS